MIGRTISHYQVLAELGRGGMGVVYLAKDHRLGREVALKFLPDTTARNPASKDRFLREARAASSLNHPSVCTIHDIGDDQGRPFIVMELLQGENLRSALRNGPLEAETLVDITIHVLKGLKAAHEKGIIHRDIKPENIFLTSGGQVKLLDFGLAKWMEDPGSLSGNSSTELTKPGALMGTVSYMSPEQLRGEPVDHRTDIYSLGMVIYEAATGDLPTRKETTAASLTAVLMESPKPLSLVRPDLPKHLSDLVFTATRKQPEERFQSAESMLRLIQASDSLEEYYRKEQKGKGTEQISGSVSAFRFPVQTSRRPMVSRQKECQVLHELLTETQRGQGKAVLIEGEPGIGKTRLLEYVQSLAVRSGMKVLLGRCSEPESGTPFLPFIEILERLTRECDSNSLGDYLGPLAPEIGRLTPRIRRALPDLPAPLEVPPERERYLLFSAFTELLERLCAEQPVLIALEDLHWADAASSALLQHIAANFASLPILIVGTHRLHDPDQSNDFSSTMTYLLRNRILRRLTLDRFSLEDVQYQLDLLNGESVPDPISKSIYGITEGNPFFVEELFEHLQMEGMIRDEKGKWRKDLSVDDFRVPDGILLVLGRRIERLNEKSRQLLQIAALLGRIFGFDLLTKCSGESAEKIIDSLEEASRLGLIAPTSTDDDIIYSFSHALIRQTLTELMSPPRKQAAHLRIAGVLEGFGERSEEDHAIDIAQHLILAGSMASSERKLNALSRTGDVALAKTAFREAADYYEKAAGYAARDVGIRGNLLFKKGLALTGISLWRDAHVTWAEALELLEKAGEKERFAELSDIMSSQLIWMGQLEAAHGVSQKAIQVLGDSDPIRRSRLLSWAGHSLSQEGNLEQGIPLTQEAFKTALQIGDNKLIGHVFSHKSCESFYLMRYQDTADAGTEAASRLQESAWDFVESRVFMLLGLLGIGKLNDVHQLAQETLGIGQRIGHLASLWMLNRVLGMTALLETANIKKFREFALQDLESCRQAKLKWISESHSWLGLTEWWSGNLGEADTQFQEAVRLEPRDFTGGSDWGFRFAFLGFTGQRKNALSLLDETGTERFKKPQTAGDWNRLLLTALGLAWLKEWDRLEVLYPFVRSSLDLGSTILFNAGGLVQTIVGVAAGAVGEWEEAENHFQAAEKLAQEIPYRAEQPEVDRWRAEFLLRRGRPKDREHAFILLQRARQRYKSLKMPLHQKISEQMLVGGPSRFN